MPNKKTTVDRLEIIEKTVTHIKNLLEQQMDIQPLNIQGGVSRIGRNNSSEEFAKLQSEAPPCSDCGCITVRNGSCYRCYNCGSSMGCS